MLAWLNARLSALDLPEASKVDEQILRVGLKGDLLLLLMFFFFFSSLLMVVFSSLGADEKSFEAKKAAVRSAHCFFRWNGKHYRRPASDTALEIRLSARQGCQVEGREEEQQARGGDTQRQRRMQQKSNLLPVLPSTQSISLLNSYF